MKGGYGINIGGTDCCDAFHIISPSGLIICSQGGCGNALGYLVWKNGAFVVIPSDGVYNAGSNRNVEVDS